MAFSGSEHPTKNSWLRLPDIIGDATAKPPIEPLIPVSKSTIYRWVLAGNFPPPSKPSPAIAIWSKQKVMLTLENWEHNQDGK
jgi:prophage regulatory protein